jgi:hypothetical protein
MYIFGYVVLLLITIIDLFVISPWESKLNEFNTTMPDLFTFNPPRFKNVILKNFFNIFLMYYSGHGILANIF